MGNEDAKSFNSAELYWQSLLLTTVRGIPCVEDIMLAEVVAVS